MADVTRIHRTATAVMSSGRGSRVSLTDYMLEGSSCEDVERGNRGVVVNGGAASLRRCEVSNF